MKDQYVLDHRSAWNALPWLANGTLEGAELNGLLDHLKSCSQCRSELRFLPELHASLMGVGERSDDLLRPEAAFQRLMNRIDDEDRASQKSSSKKERFETWTRFRSFFATSLGTVPAWGRRLMLAQGAALLILVVTFFGSPGFLDSSSSNTASLTPPGTDQAQVVPGEFQVLSSPESVDLPAEDHLKVIFRPETPERTLRKLVREVGGTIVGGPSRVGAYTVSLASEGGVSRAKAAAEKLRESEEILFAEPVFTGLEGSQD